LKYLQNYHVSIFSKNRGGPPKWMVKIMENPLKKMDDLGGKPTIFGNIHIPPVLPSNKSTSARFFVA